MQSSTRRDPGHHRSAPPGHAAIEVNTLAPSNPHLWGIDAGDVASGAYRNSERCRKIKGIISAGMLDRVEQAFPGASSRVRWRELAAPAMQERYTHTTQGNSYGLEVRISQYGPFRPRSRTAIAGLFLAGTSTVWGPATEGAMLSGLHAASAITGRDLQTEIRNGSVIADPARLAIWDADFDPLAACRHLNQDPATPAEEHTDVGSL